MSLLDQFGRPINSCQIIDDLRPCPDHHQPVNRCAECWPKFLQYLGDLCMAHAMLRQKQKIEARQAAGRIRNGI